MSHQQQQQQGEHPSVPAPPQTREEQLLAMIATLQQQVNTMLLQQQGSRVEVARPQVFSGKMEEVSVFINAARLYIRMKMTEEAVATQVAWVLSYVQCYDLAKQLSHYFIRKSMDARGDDSKEICGTL